MSSAEKTSLASETPGSMFVCAGCDAGHRRIPLHALGLPRAPALHLTHLVHAPLPVTEMEGFNSHLNIEQMNKVQGGEGLGLHEEGAWLCGVTCMPVPTHALPLPVRGILAGV